jgi:hypothetical protein
VVSPAPRSCRVLLDAQGLVRLPSQNAEYRANGLLRFWPSQFLALFGPRAIRGAGPRYPDERTSLLVGRPQVCIVRRRGIDDRQSAFPPTGVQSSSPKSVIFPATNRPDGQITSDFQKSCQAQESKRIKNISLSPPGKSRAHQLPSCPAKRGRRPSSRTWDRERWTRMRL